MVVASLLTMVQCSVYDSHQSLWTDHLHQFIATRCWPFLKSAMDVPIKRPLPPYAFCLSTRPSYIQCRHNTLVVLVSVCTITLHNKPRLRQLNIKRSKQHKTRPIYATVLLIIYNKYLYNLKHVCSESPKSSHTNKCQAENKWGPKIQKEG